VPRMVASVTMLPALTGCKAPCGAAAVFDVATIATTARIAPLFLTMVLRGAYTLTGVLRKNGFAISSASRIRRFDDYQVTFTNETLLRGKSNVSVSRRSWSITT
jgi:hypothetical protein